RRRPGGEGLPPTLRHPPSPSVKQAGMLRRRTPSAGLCRDSLPHGPCPVAVLAQRPQVRQPVILIAADVIDLQPLGAATLHAAAVPADHLLADAAPAPGLPAAPLPAGALPGGAHEEVACTSASSWSSPAASAWMPQGWQRSRVRPVVGLVQTVVAVRPHPPSQGVMALGPHN